MAPSRINRQSKGTTKRTTTTTTTTGKIGPRSKLVVRKQKHRNKDIDSEATTTTKRLVIPTLPLSWPVSSRPSTLPSTTTTNTTQYPVSALAPGSLLRQKCNGQDIHLAKTAMVMASTTTSKEKGKFLLLFPGNFSFHKSQHQQPPPPLPSTSKLSSLHVHVSMKDKDDSDNNENKTDKKNDYDDDTDLDKTATTQSSSDPDPVAIPPKSTPISTTNKTPAIWGRLEGLASDAPTFRIPFVDSNNNGNTNNKQLVFQGKQIPTTSKYLFLSCANHKNTATTTTCSTAKPKMVVQCKVRYSM
jgi:hypothetical protein